MTQMATDQTALIRAHPCHPWSTLIWTCADQGFAGCICLTLKQNALKDLRLVPGLMKVAGYHVDDKDYDCRPKRMAVAALARQESPAAVPLLVSLVDHGNQNTRLWARAALARIAKDDFTEDKQAWNKWWVGQGHEPMRL